MPVIFDPKKFKKQTRQQQLEVQIQRLTATVNELAGHLAAYKKLYGSLPKEEKEGEDVSLHSD